MAQKSWLGNFLDFSDRRKLFRFMFIVAMVSALIFGFLGFNRAVGIEDEGEVASADDPIGTCDDNLDCNIGHHSCGDGGYQYRTVNSGETCTYSGWIENHHNIWTDPVTLTINGNGCSRSISFSGCGRQDFNITGCQEGQVAFSADDSSNISISDNCQPNSRCGDGNVDPGEECDDGDDNDNDGCDTNCRLPRTCNAQCGDEEGGCLGGFQCAAGGFCRNAQCPDQSDCTCLTYSASATASCDGIAITTDVPATQNYLGVLCDGNGRTYRNNFSPGGGTISEGSGSNGTYQGPLEYGVSYSCRVFDPAGADATANTVTMPPEIDCVPACGNGRLDPNEECDDGNTVNGDGCNADCTLPETCNDVCTDALGCDGGYDCVNGNCRNNVCSDETDCVCPSCGDGTVDPGEECDEDGNNDPAGTCTPACKLTFCGDGIVQDPNGYNESEACDDGNDINGDGCSNICTTEVAGDLAITKTPSTTIVRTGDVVTYSVKVTNTGQQTLTGVAIQDDIPDGLSFVSGSITLDNQAVSDTDGFNGVVIRVSIGNLAANETATITYGLRVDTTASAASITNIAVADSNETDAVQDDATVTTPAAVVTVAPATGPGTAATIYLVIAGLMVGMAGVSFYYMRKV